MTDQEIAPVPVSWRRIDLWLGAHAPASLEHLNPPTARGEIEAVERALGTRLPADLVQSLTCHNGLHSWASLLPEQAPLSAGAIVQRWQTSMEVAVEHDGLEPRPWEEEPWWHPLWIPWAESADGNVQVVDLRPGPCIGRLGWAGHAGGGDFADGASSLSALLHSVAHALCHGGNVQGLHPYLTADSEVWWDEADRHELNGSPLRPAPSGAG